MFTKEERKFGIKVICKNIDTRFEHHRKLVVNRVYLAKKEFGWGEETSLVIHDQDNNFIGLYSENLFISCDDVINFRNTVLDIVLEK